MFLYWLFPITFRIAIMLVILLMSYRLFKVSKELFWLLCGAIIPLVIQVSWDMAMGLLRYVWYSDYIIKSLIPFYYASYYIAWLTFCVLMVIFIVRTAKLLALALQGKIKSPSDVERGGIILSLGVFGIFLCWPLGLAAWIVGRADIVKMHKYIIVNNRYDINITNYKMTKIGMVLGIIATCFAIIMIIVGLVLLGMACYGYFYMY